MRSPQYAETLKARKAFEDAVSNGFEYIRRTQELGEERFYAEMIAAAQTKDPAKVRAVTDSATEWLRAERERRELLS